MDSLIFAVNAVLPIIIMVAIGYFLKRFGFINDEFAKRANKLVFRVFLPTMLFLNVYKIDASMNIGVTYILFAIGAIAVVFVAALLLLPIATKQKNRRAPVIQAVFRSNYALIGIPLAEAFGGELGVIVASLLSAFSIPLFNVMAVVTFAVFGEGEKPSVKKVVKNILTNPLIIGVALGALFLLLKTSLADVGVTTTLLDIPIMNKVLNYLSSVATPIALIMLGAQFEFSAIPGMKREIIFATAMRVAIVPAAVISVALATGLFNSAHFAAYVALFGTPVAVSTVPMTQELGGDSALAGQLVVWTTLFSGVTLFLFSFVLKAMGIFV